MRNKVLHAFTLLCASLVTVALTVWIVYRYVPSPGEQRMKKQQAYLQEQFEILKKEIRNQNKMLNALHERDNPYQIGINFINNTIETVNKVNIKGIEYF
jgi:hypothetical protein